MTSVSVQIVMVGTREWAGHEVLTDFNWLLQLGLADSRFPWCDLGADIMACLRQFRVRLR